jgi:tol-pal system protein YbgF
VRNLETRLAKLEEDAKAQAQLLKSRDDELKQLRDATEQRATVYDGSADIALGENEAIRKDFDNAWRSYERKDYQVAAIRFRDFAKKYPKSRLTASAQFWLGESHFAMKEFDKAIVAYDEVRRFPQTDKAPAALLRQGFAFAELGEKLNARLVLQELVEKFPQSAEAPRAKQRLKALES